MRCTSKIKSLLLCGCILTGMLAGCGTEDTVEDAYNIYSTSAYSFTTADSSSVATYSSDLCVVDTESVNIDNTHYSVAGGAGLFNATTNEVNYAYNVHEQLYPASTTKVLTLYIAVTQGNLDDVVTVSANATNQTSDSSVCGLNTGDQITLRDLLYGMMLRSGNDAAIAIAEHIAGSTDAFADIMNEVAASLGATNSHFVNPNGLPDSDHYTTVYDMYLIMNAAIQNQDFLTVLTAQSYTANYTDVSGTAVTQAWITTNQYLTGNQSMPTGITVLGGKTGTTGAAGYCLILYSQNTAGDSLISIVYKADCRSNLYLLMDEILANYGNL